jgi:hypothetical protein
MADVLMKIIDIGITIREVVQTAGPTKERARLSRRW